MDGVILAGPLYHLPERAERLRALAEAHRVLRPGGVVLAFGITRYAGLVYAITRGLVHDPDAFRMVRDEVRTGHRRDPPPGAFTLPDAYFHLPSELAHEVRDAGFAVEAVLGVRARPGSFRTSKRPGQRRGAARSCSRSPGSRRTSHRSVLGFSWLGAARTEVIRRASPTRSRRSWARSIGWADAPGFGLCASAHHPSLSSRSPPRPPG
jgi:SAM-dependent methyltransferase